jgi:predicted AAA+ superfamily ATPase
MPPTSGPISPFTLLTADQHIITLQISNAMIHETHQFMFLQGLGGTGRSSTVKALISLFSRMARSI